MRISDWSSDVCSSDLTEVQIPSPCASAGNWRVIFVHRWSMLVLFEQCPCCFKFTDILLQNISITFAHLLLDCACADIVEVLNQVKRTLRRSKLLKRLLDELFSHFINLCHALAKPLHNCFPWLIVCLVENFVFEWDSKRDC